jgi:hypothetical protein
VSIGFYKKNERIYIKKNVRETGTVSGFSLPRPRLAAAAFGALTAFSKIKENDEYIVSIGFYIYKKKNVQTTRNVRTRMEETPPPKPKLCNFS